MIFCINTYMLAGKKKKKKKTVKGRKYIQKLKAKT